MKLYFIFISIIRIFLHRIFNRRSFKEEDDEEEEDDYFTPSTEVGSSSKDNHNGGGGISTSASWSQAYSCGLGT